MAALPLLLSPPAVSVFPLLILQVAIFGYLRKGKDKAASIRWLNRWLNTVLLGNTFLFLGAVVYHPVGGYLELGALAFFFISIVPSLQFAYHFPRLTFERESQAALLLSTLIAAGCLLWMVFEQAFYPIAFQYSFDQFAYYNPVRVDTGLMAVSIPIFDLVYSLSLVWIWLIWVRKTRYFSSHISASDQLMRTQPGRARRVFSALLRPRGREAGTTYAFAVLMLSCSIIYLISTLELWTPLLSGSSVALYLVALSCLLLIYINNSSAPTSFMVKLVGISLVTILVLFGLTIPYFFSIYDEAYDANRRSEIPYVISQIEQGETTGLPEELVYVVSRPAPAAGIFPITYRLLFSKTADFDEKILSHEDSRIIEVLRSGGPAGLKGLLEGSPWLNPERALLSQAGSLEQLLLPEGKRAYRGVTIVSEGHFIRYTSRSEDGRFLYELGYSYQDYRRTLHEKALPLIYLLIGATLLILLIFPRFFGESLVRPLQNLLDGVAQVNSGELTVNIPITARDEIGYLTESFNNMMKSLQTLHNGLQAEILERQRAEAEVRSLNATLEQRIAHRTRELAVLYEVSAAASQAKDLETLLGRSLSQAVEALNGDMGAVFLLKEAENLSDPPGLSLVAHHRLPSGRLPMEIPLRAEDPLFRQLILKGEPLMIYNISVDDRIPPAMRGLGARSLLMAPLRAEGQVLGVMSLIHRPGETFNAEEIALLASIADQIGIAVHSDRLLRQAVVLEERHRLARDLHDSVTQSLYGLVALAEAGQARFDAGEVEAATPTYARIAETARQALNEMRLFVHRLRPLELEQQGLVTALRKRLAAVESWSGVNARLVADEGLQLPLPEAAALYQIAQEALNNALKYAHASSITLTFQRHLQGAVLQIADDGCGFDIQAANRKGLGLQNMYERARAVGATLEIDSHPGKGTKVKVFTCAAKSKF